MGRPGVRLNISLMWLGREKHAAQSMSGNITKNILYELL